MSDSRSMNVTVSACPETSALNGHNCVAINPLVILFSVSDHVIVKTPDEANDVCINPSYRNH